MLYDMHEGEGGFKVCNTGNCAPPLDYVRLVVFLPLMFSLCRYVVAVLCAPTAAPITQVPMTYVDKIDRDSERKGAPRADRYYSSSPDVVATIHCKVSCESRFTSRRLCQQLSALQRLLIDCLGLS